ncbi:MAG: hypoxanthine phosphoribosyltransferase [Planctomycetota bacterium]
MSQAKQEKLTDLFSVEQIQQRVKSLGKQITQDYQGKELVVIGVLKGSLIFMADLIREIKLSLTCDFVRYSSYEGGLESTGVVRIELDLSQNINNKEVLVVEDIVDTGLTISYLVENFKTRHPKSLRICSLLFKPENLKKDVPIDYIGFSIPKKFVVGYGLDYEGRYRNYPAVATLSFE